MTQMNKCQAALVDTDSDSFFQLVACQTPDLAPLDPNEKEIILHEKMAMYMSSNREFCHGESIINTVSTPEPSPDELLPLWNQIQIN